MGGVLRRVADLRALRNGLCVCARAKTNRSSRGSTGLGTTRPPFPLQAFCEFPNSHPSQRPDKAGLFQYFEDDREVRTVPGSGQTIDWCHDYAFQEPFVVSDVRWTLTHISPTHVYRVSQCMLYIATYTM